MTKITVIVSPSTVFKSRPVDSSTLPPSQKVEIQQGQAFQLLSSQRQGTHYFVRLTQPIPPVGSTGYFFAPHVEIEQEEIHGVWLTNVDSEVLFSLENIREALSTLRGLGFNTVYPTVWQGGYTLYPSDVAKRLVGAEVYPEPRLQNRDMLAEIVDEGHKQGFRVLPWFEFGLMTPTDSNLATNHPELLTQTINGDRASDGMGCAWLNPAQLQVQTFMVDLIGDVVKRYDVDGVQLDDHFGLHVKQGYDPFTEQLYQEERGLTPPADEQEANWKEWRAEKVTNLLDLIFNAVKTQSQSRSSGRDCLMSVSPGGAQAFSFDNYLVDWQKWVEMGYVEELVPQFYRNTLAAFSNEAAKGEVITARNHIPTVLGIGASVEDDQGQRQPMPFDLIRQEAELTRNQGFAGMSFFFYESLWNIKPDDETINDRQQGFKQLLNS